MGVPRFYGWLSSKRYKAVLRRRLPGNISSLLLDMNGIFHQVAQQVYAYGSGENPRRLKQVLSMSPQDLLQEYFIAVGNKLEKILREIYPRHNLIMAVDGVAPQAKIAQQRSRRYGKMKEERTHITFDSSAITPGTDFMILLDNYLKQWIDVNKQVLPPKVIYSSHLVPGEGEHKIMDFIREGELFGEGSHVLYGLDADLIMLSLAAPINKIYLKREDLSNVIDIDNLRTALTEEMSNSRPSFTTAGSKAHAPVINSVHDFVVMITLIGNDFVPSQTSMSNLDYSIASMMNAYKELNAPLTKDLNIIWENLGKFFIILTKYEPTLLNKASKTPTKFPSQVMNSAITITETRGGVSAHTISQAGTRHKTFNFDAYRNAWYNWIFTPKDPNKVSEKLVAISTVTTGSSTATTGSSTPISFITLEKIQQLIENYLTGIYWTYNYYVKGPNGINMRWYYPNYYAPLIIDIAAFFSELKSPVQWQPIPGQQALNSIYQLLSVIPPTSAELVPLEVRYLMTQTSSLSDLYPVDFEIDLDGKNAEYRGIALLPFVDPNRVISVVNAQIKLTPDRAALYAPGSNLILTQDESVGQFLESKRAALELANMPQRHRRQVVTKTERKIERKVETKVVTKRKTRSQRVKEWKALELLM